MLSPSPPLLPRAWRALGHAALFLAALVGMAALLAPLAPLPELSALSEKWDYLRAHREEFDTLFIGSSRVYRQILPQRFDLATAAAGKPTHSFNCGQDGMFPPESFFALRKVLTLSLPRLRWVFIELTELNLEPPEVNAEAAQSIYWHDWHHTQLLLRELWRTPQPWPAKLALAWPHGQLWLRQALHLGAATAFFRRSLWTQGETPAAPLWIAFVGAHPGHTRALAGPERLRYLEAVAQRRRLHPPIPERPVLVPELASLITLVRQAGAEPIFLLSPSNNHPERFGPLPGGASLLDFEPADCPELYQPELHYDQQHLNTPGAVLYTDLLARRFVALETLRKER